MYILGKIDTDCFRFVFFLLTEKKNCYISFLSNYVADFSKFKISYKTNYDLILNKLETLSWFLNKYFFN